MFYIFPSVLLTNDYVCESHCLILRQRHCIEDSQIMTKYCPKTQQLSVCQVSHSLAIFFSMVLANSNNKHCGVQTLFGYQKNDGKVINYRSKRVKTLNEYQSKDTINYHYLLRL